MSDQRHVYDYLEVFIVSPTLRTAVLLGIGASDSDIEALLADFRRADYAIVRGVLGT